MSKEQQQEQTNHYSSIDPFSFSRTCDGRDRGKVERTTKAILSLSRLFDFVETSQTLPVILFFTAITYKQNRIVAINVTQTLILCLQVEGARSKMLCVVDYCFANSIAFSQWKKSYFPLRPEPLIGYKLSWVALGTRMTKASSFAHNLATQKIELIYLARSRLQPRQQEIWVRNYVSLRGAWGKGLV